ncbi:hypothetical protein GHW10_25230 [Pseudomonas aeruginosa]|nr:hypothetical protein [Pseudomonas aeruginosa]
MPIPYRKGETVSCLSGGSFIDEFTGRNQRELAMKHNVSLQFVYRVLKRMRLAFIARNQGDLFHSHLDEEE